jgi:DNA recombination protein RmuC
MDLLLAFVVGAAVGAAVAALLAASRLRLALAELAAERRLAADREQRLPDTLKALTDDALSRAQQSLLTLARQERSAESSAARESLAGAVAPLQAALAALEAHVRSLEAAREGAYGSLSTSLRALLDTTEHLRSETNALVTALRSPVQRGRWGELQLRRVVELAGMQQHCDFDEQVTVPAADGTRARPDLVVRLPGGKSVPVDAKVPLDAYLSALDATDELSHRRQLERHARQLRTHVDALAGRRYDALLAAAPEFVVLFVPGEPILSAALTADPGLLEYASEQRVMLTSPASLIALLKTVAYGWRQESVAANAREVCRLGRDLHDRLAGLVDRITKLGRSLESSVRDYNACVGTLESRVLVSARRLRDLDVATEPIGEVVPLECVPRPLLSRVRASPETEQNDPFDPDEGAASDEPAEVPAHGATGYR